MGHIIEEAWNWEKHFGVRLKNTKTAVKEWNKMVFGNVQMQIEQARDNIKEL